MAHAGVFCGGSWLVDRTKLVDHWPAEETVAVILEETHQAGGPGMNLAINLKRLGAVFPVEGVGVVGDDDAGRFLLDCCRRHDVESSRILTTPESGTSYTDVMTSRVTGKRTFFHSQGANGLLTPEHFDFTGCEGKLLHLGAPGIHRGMDAPWEDEPSGWVAVLKKAQAAGLRTNMELISLPAEELVRLGTPCLPHLDTIIINDVEVGALAGLDTAPGGKTSVSTVERAAQSLLEQGVKELVAVHFPAGCIVARPGRPIFRSPSTRVPPDSIICAVGAGDAFASGLIYGLLMEWTLEKSAALAHAAAAICLGSLSTNEAFGAAEVCLAQADAWGWRESL